MFLCSLFDLDPDVFVDLLREQAEDLVNPPMTFDELLGQLARVAPDLVLAVRTMKTIEDGSFGRYAWSAVCQVRLSSFRAP